ncbi:polypeptide deformylase [Listeria floridensis FSL S10-1187]|uniref:Polypeptide deformylase n=1 Tax=Listeria floridensis FSL S10-1187 TaxID=1265817 RepID=A0ABN0RHH4_9LIST|nr:DNA-processing protein DprA [Listeria floridensis]EUJ33308.1 polypeptide deformylase [Listeria floridensis FSL S10-1187]
MFYHDKEYPIQLKEISFAPPILFYRGNLSLLHSDIIGIVGSHAMRPYGRAVTRLFVNGLYGTSFNLMSGSLHGIEELTLRIALQCGGRIICVLTTGIDQVFPRCNQQLVNQVSESGLIISEYTPETVFQRKNLEERSRLISGIARGILIPEAAKQSSSLRTVYYGVEQNREIFAVPGNIFSEESGGANALIAEGAQMVTKPKEIVESFKF